MGEGLKFIIGFLFFVVLTWWLLMQYSADYKQQCDGETKTFASLGRVYACDNYVRK